MVDIQKHEMFCLFATFLNLVTLYSATFYIILSVCRPRVSYKSTVLFIKIK